MSWVSRLVEQRLAAAAQDGGLDGGPLTGKPLPDIDRQRPVGWWAEQFVRRELSHDRQRTALAAARAARARFWQAESLDQLRDRVALANQAIVRANLNMVDGDRIEPFDPDDIISRWRDLDPARR